MKLSNATLAHIPIQTPNYDRTNVTAGIVHLGLGAFHRAHQAVFIDDCLQHDPSWGILGASLRSDAVAKALNPQDGLYSVITRSGRSEAYRVIGSLLGVISAPADPNGLIARMADPIVRIVSLTITEKGYCSSAQGGDVDIDAPDIKHDLANPDTPRSAPGYIVAALAKRKAQGIGPFSVLSCDNLSNNGQVARNVVCGLARRIDVELADWIDREVTFPSSMVDRIVPATTADDNISAANNLGVTDAWPVTTEPFGQWVIEDRFCAGRPAFDDPRVILTNEVHPFETMKLRLLNGSHSAIAYLGLLRGHATVSQAIRDPIIRDFVTQMMSEEITPDLAVPDGIDLNQYCKELVQRFENQMLNHSLTQIAMDGSQKLPQRILEPIRARLAVGAPYCRLASVIALWLKFIALKGATGYRFTLTDPMADVLREAAINAAPPFDVLQITEIFGDLSQSAGFLNNVQSAYFGIDALTSAHLS